MTGRKHNALGPLGLIGCAVAVLSAALFITWTQRTSGHQADETPGAGTATPVDDDYYAAIPSDAAGDDLRAAIHKLIRAQRQLSYADTWAALAKTDQDPDEPGRVVLFYTGWTRPAAHRDDAGNLLWNREHVWARSRGGFGTQRGPGTDLHMLRPTDASTNNARGNKAFDEGGELYIDGDGPTTNRTDADSWEPRDAVKGDTARALFYAAIRYEDRSMDLELTDEAMPQSDNRPLHGRLSALLRWHKVDPPDDRERLRNELVQEMQGNRNPFVDRPEWVERIWGEASKEQHNVR